MQFVDPALRHRPDLDVQERNRLVEADDLGLVARQPVQRFRHHDVEPAGTGDRRPAPRSPFGRRWRWRSPRPGTPGPPPSCAARPAPGTPGSDPGSRPRVTSRCCSGRRWRREGFEPSSLPRSRMEQARIQQGREQESPHSVARQSGWAVSGDQDGDLAALGVMIVAPDCRWQAASSVVGQLACSRAGSGVVEDALAEGSPLRVVAARRPGSEQGRGKAADDDRLCGANGACRSCPPPVIPARRRGPGSPPQRYQHAPQCSQVLVAAPPSPPAGHCPTGPRGKLCPDARPNSSLPDYCW